MNKHEFCKKLQESLEINSMELTEKTVLKEVEEYDSMSVMGIIAFTDEHFGVKLTAKQLSSITDIKSLINLIGADKFES
jgi:acyl carrier protein